MQPSATELQWGCHGGHLLDIKKWFVSVITPDFDTAEARVRCGDLEDLDHVFTPGAMLKSPTRLMRDSYDDYNPNNGAYARMDTPDRPLCVRWFGPLEPGSVRTASSALAATALGAGALALPYAFSLTGIGLGLLTLTLAAIVSSMSLQILMMAARYTNTKSYAAILKLALGTRSASAALDLIVLLNGVGAITCCLIFEGDFIPAVFAKPPGMTGFAFSREYAVMGAAAAVWPLTMSGDISALRYVAVAVPIVLLVTIAIVVCDAPGLHTEMRAQGGRVVWWDFDFRRWLQALAIMVNAFANHQNAIPCANDLSNPSVARIVKATVNGNLIVWALLSALGIGGYVSWGQFTMGDFLLNYPEGLPEIWACRLMLALIVYLVLPVALLPTAKSGAQLVLSITKNAQEEVGRKLHAVSATVLLASCTLIAANVQNVASVIGILGGLLAASLMFWFPAIVYRWLLWPTQPQFIRGAVLCSLLFFGVCGWTSVTARFV